VSSVGRRFNPLNAPIAVQVVLMLIGGLLVSQAITLALVLLVPPPPPPVYRLDEVAAALEGGPLRLRDGRVLRRVRSAAPPTVGPGERRDDLAAALADRLQTDPARVRLRFDRPPLRGPRRLGATEFDGPRLGPPGADFDRPHGPPPERDPGHDPWRAPGFRPHRPDLIVGEFTAAWRDASGRWRTVAPEPKPFFSGWRRDITLWFLGCVAVLAPVGYLFARRLTAPIRRFAQAAERLGRDPGGPALALEGPAEIGAAAQAFNLMQQRLRRYVEDRTAMIAAISHDLRTPLARMRFKLEKAQPELRATLGADVEQMEQMVAAVLAFVRDSDTARARARTRLDLLSLLECAVDDATFAGARVVIEDAEPTEIEGDPVALRSVFANLIDNGVKYGASVTVGLRRDAAEAIVEIADTGPGLAEGELERVFAPFYRAEPSRNRKTGGIGLGLAVARAIARSHGGDVTLAPGPEHGLVATVRLPLGLAGG
jgi:signal transduction histidine kinase